MTVSKGATTLPLCLPPLPTCLPSTRPKGKSSALPVITPHPALRRRLLLPWDNGGQRTREPQCWLCPRVGKVRTRTFGPRCPAGVQERGWPCRDLVCSGNQLCTLTSGSDPLITVEAVANQVQGGKLGTDQGRKSPGRVSIPFSARMPAGACQSSVPLSLSLSDSLWLSLSLPVPLSVSGSLSLSPSSLSRPSARLYLGSRPWVQDHPHPEWSHLKIPNYICKDLLPNSVLLPSSRCSYLLGGWGGCHSTCCRDDLGDSHKCPQWPRIHATLAVQELWRREKETRNTTPCERTQPGHGEPHVPPRGPRPRRPQWQEPRKRVTFPARTCPTRGLLGSPPQKRPVLRAGIST